MCNTDSVSLVAVEIIFPDSSHPTLSFFVYRYTSITSLYNKVAREVGVETLSFRLSHGENLFLPFSVISVGQLVHNPTNSISLRFVSEKETSYYKLLPSEDKNIAGSKWRDVLYPSSVAPPFPVLPESKPICVNDGGTIHNINCYHWTDVETLKEYIWYKLGIQTESQGYIWEGRLLHNEEILFPLFGNEPAKTSPPLNLILITYHIL